MEGFTGTIKTKALDSNGNIIKQFQPNFLWRYLKNKFNKDIQIPLLTGFKRSQLVIHNNITQAGLARFIQFMATGTGNKVVAAAVGTGSPLTNTLGNEIARELITYDIITTAIPNDTVQYECTFTFNNSTTLTEEGLFDDPVSGNMIAYKTIPALFMPVNASYILTHEIQAKNV